MKKIQWILGVFASLSCIVVLVITSFEIAMYSDFDWYEKEYKKYNVMKNLTMELDDVMDVTHEMMDYLRGEREDLVVYTTIDGEENQEFFNEQDKIHMADVQNLFLGGLKLRVIAIFIMIVCVVLIALTKGKLKSILPRAFQIAVIIAVIVSAMIGVYASLDFNAFFTRFHEIFFTNDLWIFNPATDYMIRMLPESFFADMVLRIGTIFAIGLLLLLVLSIICDKLFPKKKLGIGEDNC